MAAARELVTDDRDSRFQREIMPLGLQQVVESPQEMKSLGLQKIESLDKVEALLKVLVESQVNTQLQLSQIVNSTSITTGANYKNEERKHKASLNLSSSSKLNPLDQLALVSASSTLLTPEEDTITTTAATKNLAANKERPSTVNDNQEITQVIPDDHNDLVEKFADEDGGQVMGKDEYKELYNAARNSDWEVARKFLEKNPEAITKVIASDSRTVLHVAITDANQMFTEEIVKMMPPEILEYKTGTSGYTALHYAAMFGFVKAAKVMVDRNPRLTQILSRNRIIPLHGALNSATAGQRETVEYLYSVTRHEHPSPFSGHRGGTILRRMIDAGFYDIASSLVQRFPELVIDQRKKVQISVMNCMAERPFAFASGAKLTFWQRRIYPLVKVDINTTYELNTQTNKRNSLCTSEESLLQILEGTNVDEEDPVERFEEPCEDEKCPAENSENMEADEEKPFKWEIIWYLIYHMIKFVSVLLVFLVRFIIPWTPEPHIIQLHKHIYNDKAKHKQAKALVRNIFKLLQKRLSKRKVKEFFVGSNVMKMAIKHGSVEFVEVCIQLFPYLIWYKMGGQYMVQMAIAERDETILNLICKKCGKNKIDIVSRDDDKGNNVLHYAAKLAPSAQLNSVSGAYLQMQREIQWFKGVENMISEQMKFKRNKNGDTAHDIFTKEHKELKESGEKWLKDTSGSCMVVAALIATVAFASAFTVPGVYVVTHDGLWRHGSSTCPL
ncbi:hypothetical protein MKW98_020605 [Papaver atlanticum]|uniref:PGG domain-containing protein n=1 Tax=Papaver atlanticum TaxID=357466 RepID=A0AAD4TI05_9MAGN|nr:hypothetical protein MKW98_020605 [Papaver atlanticum]